MVIKGVKEACVVSILVANMLFLKVSSAYALNMNKGVFPNRVEVNNTNRLDKKTYKVIITSNRNENFLVEQVCEETKSNAIEENKENVHKHPKVKENSFINEAISFYSSKYGVDEKLIKSLIKQESNFDPNCVSFVGAIGLMQIMPNTIKKFNVCNPYDIYENIDAGTRHLKGMIERYEGDIVKAVAAYNCGGNALDKSGFKSLDDVSMLPKETRIHVTKVFYYYNNWF